MAERIDPLETMPVSPHARLTRRLLWLLAVIVMAFLYLPIVLLVLFSFNEPRTPGLPITGLTLDWYEEALTNRVLLEAVRDFFQETGKAAGVKAAGGIRTSKEALQYLVLVKETLGDRWLTPDLFRFGASTLVNDVLMQLAKERTGRYQNEDHFSKD